MERLQRQFNALLLTNKNLRNDLEDAQQVIHLMESERLHAPVKFTPYVKQNFRIATKDIVDYATTLTLRAYAITFVVKVDFGIFHADIWIIIFDHVKGMLPNEDEKIDFLHNWMTLNKTFYMFCRQAFHKEFCAMIHRTNYNRLTMRNIYEKR